MRCLDLRSAEWSRYRAAVLPARKWSLSWDVLLYYTKLTKHGTFLYTDEKLTVAGSFQTWIVLVTYSVFPSADGQAACGCRVSKPDFRFAVNGSAWPSPSWISFEVSVLCAYSRPAPEEPAKVKPEAEKAPVRQRPVLEKTFLDRDVEYLFEKNEQDTDLDEQLKEDLRKKKSDPRYIEMQVLFRVLCRKLLIVSFV